MSFKGTTLRWYTRLHENHKRDGISFVPIFKGLKNFLQIMFKYAKVEAHSLITIKLLGTTVLRSNWCNETSPTLNLKFNRALETRYLKQLNDVTKKRQGQRIILALHFNIRSHSTQL